MKYTSTLGHFFRPQRNLGILIASFAFLGDTAHAATYTWNDPTTGGIWSTGTNWSPTQAGTPPFVGGDTADFSTLSITGGTAIVSTLDSDVTLGSIVIGSTATSNAASWNLTAASTSDFIEMNGNGADSAITQIATSGGDTIAIGLALDNNLDLTNASTAKTLTISSAITDNTGPATSIISNLGAGAVVLSGTITDNANTSSDFIGITQNGTGSLTISGTGNNYHGNTTLDQGSLIIGTSTTNILGTGALVINGGTLSSSAASTVTLTNAVSLDGSATIGGTKALTLSGQVTNAGTNTLTNSNTAATVLSGGIAVASGDTLTIANTGAAMTIGSTGTVSGAGNLTLNANSTNAITVSAPITLSGTLTNSGTSTGTTSISGAITGAAALAENSATSQLSITGANTAWTGTLTINLGNVLIGSTAGASGTGLITLGSGTAGTAALLSNVNGNSTIGNSITLAASAVGVETLNLGTVAGSAGSAATPTFNGTLTLNGNTLNILSLSSPFPSNQYNTASVTLHGNIVGSGVINAGVEPLGGNINGAGIVTLSGNNSGYSGTTNFLAGTLSFGSATALGTGTLVIGGGINGTWNGFGIAGSPALDNSSGGTLVLTGTTAETWNSNFIFTGTNSLTLGNGAISLGTAATANRLVNVAANTLTVNGVISNGTNATIATTGTVKNGAGILVLGAAEAYTGGTTINGGNLQFNAASLPSGAITINNGGSLNVNLTGGAFSSVQAYLNSGAIAAGSTGDIALTANDTTDTNINFSAGGYNNLMLGATSAGASYAGTLTPGNNGYRLGGGGGTLTLSGLDVLTGSNNLTVGALSVVGVFVGNSANSTLGTSSGTVKLTNVNDMSGATTVNAGTLDLSAASNTSIGSLANSAITVNNGATLTFDSTNVSTVTDVVTRAASLTLDGGIFTDIGTSGIDITDKITGALTLNTGSDAITIMPSGVSRSLSVNAASLVLGNHSFALINGVNLGAGAPGTNLDGSITFASFVGGVAPSGTFTGSTSQTTGGISASLTTGIIANLVGAVSTTAGPTLGFGTAGSANTFLTYDTTNGLRPLALSEYNSNAIASGDNTYLTLATTSSSTASINSLVVSGTTALTIADGTTLTDASGALLFTAGGTIAPSASTGILAFGSNTAYVDAVSSTASINAVISGTGGLVKEGVGTLSLGNGSNTLSGGIYILNGILSTSATVNPYGSNTIYLGDTGGNNSTQLRWSGPSNLIINNNIIVQGGNTGNSTIIGGNFNNGAVTYSGTITLGSANVTGTVVGHNLTIDDGAFDLNANAMSIIGIVQDPAGLTGPAGVLALNISGDNSFGYSLTFGNAASTYSGGTVITFTGSATNSQSIAFTNSPSGSIFGTGLVTVNGMHVNDAAATVVSGTNNQVWNGDWSMANGQTLDWNLSGNIDLGNIGSGTIRTLTEAGGILQIGGTIQNGSNGLTNSLATTGGTLVLTANNTYTGTTTLLSGTLQLGNGGTTGAIANNMGASFAVPAAANLMIDHSNSQTLGSVLGNNGIVSGAGNFTQAGSGVLTINKAQTYTGTTTISGGGGLTLAVNSGGSLNGVTGTALTFSGNGGTFNFDNTGSSASTTQGMGVLTTNAGEDTIQSTYGSGGNVTLAFTNVASRPAGAAVDFVDNGGTFTGPTPNNKIVLTQINGATTPIGTLLNKGYFFNSGSYAAYDANGFVRAYNYTTDAGGVVTAGGATFGTVTSSSNVQMNGAITAQTTATLNTININGANNLTLSNTNGTTLNVLGILKTGGNAATITSGTGTGEAVNNTGIELMIRTDQSADSLTIASVIAGAGGLTKSGAGSLALSGANTYTGVTTVDAGTLDINSVSALGAGTSALILNNGSTIDNTSGTGITTSTAHALTLAGDFTFGGTNALTFTGAVSLGANDEANRTVTVNGTGALTLNGIVSNGTSTIVPTTGLIKAGTGTLVLGGLNTFTGGLMIDNGTVSVASLLALGTAQPLGEGPLTLAGATSSTSGTLQYTGASTAWIQNVTVTTGSFGTITNTGGGTLTLSGILNKTNATLTFSGGIFDVTGQITGGTSSTFNSDLVVNSGATVTLDNANDNYTGPTDVYGGGTLKDGTGTAPAGTVLTLGNSSDGAVTNTFNLNGNNQTLGALDGVSNVGSTNVNTVTNGAASGTATLTLTGLNSDNAAVGSNYNGAITDGATAHTALAITGGVHVFSGASSYTGGTTLSGGTFYANNTSGSATGTGTVSVASGATLAGSGTIAPVTISGNAVNVATGGMIMPGGLQPTPSPTAVANGSLTLDPTNVSGGNLLNMGASTNATSPSLVFALGSGGSTSGSQILVGGTAANVINFNAGGTGSTATVLAINDLVAGGLTLNQNYVLIQGNGNTVFEDNGLALSVGNGTLTASGMIIGGLQLLAPNTPGNFFSQWYNTSELFLVGNDIEVEVIPEPGTWALMLGGFALLVFFQRRKSKSE